MSILLFITSINKTLDNVDKKDYIELINNLKKIMENNYIDLTYISFCDNTPNKNMILYHTRNIDYNINTNHIYLGKQFLGNAYYNDINSGEILYKNGKLNKLSEIINYVKELENNYNEVKLIIVDNELNTNIYENELNQCGINPLALISHTTSLKEINEYLQNLSDIKKKNLNVKLT